MTGRTSKRQNHSSSLRLVNKLKNEFDTRYFDKYEEEDPWWVPDYDQKISIKRNTDNYEDFVFFDFTLKKDIEVEKQKLVENYFNNLKKLAGRTKKLHIKQNKPVIIKDDSLTSFVYSGTDKHRFTKLSHSKKKNLKRKKTEDVFLKLKQSSKSITPFKLGTKSHSRRTQNPRPESKPAKTKKLMISKSKNKNIFQTCALKCSKNDFKKISIVKNFKSKFGKSSNKKKKSNNETDFIDYKFFKTSVQDENKKDSFNVKKSPKLVNKINFGERSIKNKFVINIKNFQSPVKSKNFLLDFLNTNVYKKERFKLSSSQKRLKTEMGSHKTKKYKNDLSKKIKLKSPYIKNLLESKFLSRK